MAAPAETEGRQGRGPHVHKGRPRRVLVGVLRRELHAVDLRGIFEALWLVLSWEWRQT